MASPPVTFPCPFCGRRMGVPAELLGKQVRCPHCKQVVTAPVTAGTAPAPVPVVVVPPEPAAPEPELRAFNIPPKKEGADSILSEPNESEDEVFGSQPGARLAPLPLPDAPPPSPPATEPAPVPDDPFGFGPSPAPTPAAPPAPAPRAVARPLVTETAFDLPPNTRPNPPAPPAVSDPEPAPLPRPVAPAGGNPFADFDAPPAPGPVLVPVPVKPAKATAEADEPPDDEPPPRKKKRRDDAERDERPTRVGRPRTADSGGAKNVVLVLLIGYAVVATAVAVYGLFFRSGDAVDTGHPLSTIPDDFGEFDPVKRKKVTQLKFPVDGELPAAQRAALGGKVAVGQLEVQPKEIRRRRLEIELHGVGEVRKEFTGPALVLILDIKNTSSDLSVFPMDPAFTRKADPGAAAASRPITRLVVGKQVFAGGEIEWPLPVRVTKKLEAQQANDAKPLTPGESREYVVFTEAKPEVVKAALAAKEPMQWRVQVRRGLIEYKGKDVPVTAVIGVDFKAADIITD